jgi:hypothetical protein
MDRVNMKNEKNMIDTIEGWKLKRKDYEEEHIKEHKTIANKLKDKNPTTKEYKELYNKIRFDCYNK